MSMVPPQRVRHEVLDPRIRDVEAVVFDTDGVITDSARPHAAAWKEAFDACLREHPLADGVPRRPFDNEDYRRRVDGRSRREGAAAFLESRGLHLRDEDVDDPPGTATVSAGGPKGAAVPGTAGRGGRHRLAGHGPDAPGAERRGGAVRRGGFGLVVGVDRAHGPTSAADLREHGADLVVADLGELLVPIGDQPRGGTG
jgi:hypothetical protein